MKSLIKLINKTFIPDYCDYANCHVKCITSTGKLDLDYNATQMKACEIQSRLEVETDPAKQQQIVWELILHLDTYFIQCIKKLAHSFGWQDIDDIKLEVQCLLAERWTNMMKKGKFQRRRAILGYVNCCISNLMLQIKNEEKKQGEISWEEWEEWQLKRET